MSADPTDWNDWERAVTVLPDGTEIPFRRLTTLPRLGTTARLYHDLREHPEQFVEQPVASVEDLVFGRSEP